MHKKITTQNHKTRKGKNFKQKDMKFCYTSMKGSYQVYKIYRTVTVGKKPKSKDTKETNQGNNKRENEILGRQTRPAFSGKRGGDQRFFFFFLLLLDFPLELEFEFFVVGLEESKPTRASLFPITAPTPQRERKRKKKSWDHCWYSGLSGRRLEELQRKTCHSLLYSLRGWVFVMILPHKVRGSKDC